MTSKVIAKVTVKKKLEDINNEFSSITSRLKNDIISGNETLIKLERLKGEIISIGNVYTEILLNDNNLKHKFLRMHSKIYKLYHQCNAEKSNTALKF